MQKLRGSRFNFTEDAKYFKGGTCPACRQKTLYIKKENLFKVVCNRKEKCRYSITIKELFPDLFGNLRKSAPATPEDPTKTVDTYLQWMRGFRDLSLFKGHYVQNVRKILGVEYPTARFYLAEGVYWEKIIDSQGRDSHFEGSYKGLAWSLHPKEDLKGSVFLTEGIFDAMALEISGRQAVSAMSAGHIPDAYLTELLGRGIRWHAAYDNDNAGIEGVKKIVDWLHSQGEEVVISLPETGKDWNDHLRDGKIFEDDFFDDCRFRGELIEAQDPKSYGEILVRKYRMPLCFEFDDCYWGIYQEKNDQIVSRQSNFSLQLLYTLNNETTDDVLYMFRVKYKNKSRDREIQLSSSKISNLQAFREGVMNRAPGAIWKGQQQALYFNLLEKYFLRPPVEVRCLQQIGYDDKTRAYVFPDHAYAADGRLIEPNEHDFISFSSKHDDNVKVIAKKKNNHFRREESFDWKVTDTLIDAWSWEGFCVFSWFFVSCFCEQIGNEFGWFPFLSIYGPPNTGKSSLVKLAWKFLGRNHEGIQATKKFSDKYIARQLALFSGIPTVIKEINKAPSSFNLEDLLPAFDRDPIIGRAEMTHGLETYDFPFRSALIFAQNEEPFESQQLKSRIISLKFCDKRFNLHNKISLAASKVLRKKAISEVCGFRHFIMSQHQQHLQDLMDLYPVNEEKFFKISETSRVAQNYALLWTACTILGKHVPRWEEIRASCFDYLVQSIKEKERILQLDNFMLNRFFEVLDDLVISGRLSNHAPYLKQNEEVRFSWKEFQMLANDDNQHDLFKDVPQLQNDLQGTSRFRKYASMHSEKTGRNLQLWAFSGDFQKNLQTSFDNGPKGK